MTTTLIRQKRSIRYAATSVAKKADVPTFVDLFSGAGGLSLGFEQAGFANIFSVDMEPEFCKTYAKNFPHHTLVQADITMLSQEQLVGLTHGIKVDVVVGGPPCQGFSMAGNIGRKFLDDPRNHLFKEFIRVVDILKPKFFVMENVARLYTHNGGKTREDIMNRFSELGYSIFCNVFNTADYGVPQNRRRIVFIGSKGKLPNDVLKKGNIKSPTIKEVIGNLPPLVAGECSSISNHEAMRHSDQMLKKMSYVGNGGDRSSIPKHLRPTSGDVRKYIRYASDKPSVCVTGDMRKIFHYTQNRALTVRELARIQTFPDYFVFEGSKISQQQQVGNAVPPLFAYTIGSELKKLIYAAA